jgi:hypothetical protein
MAGMPQPDLSRGHGLFSGGMSVGSPLRNFIGALADALSVAGGGQPLYQQRLKERRSQSAISQYLGSVDPELAGLLSSGLDSSTALGLYKIRHPESDTPAALKEFSYYKGLRGQDRSSYENFLRLTHPGMMAPVTLGQNDTIEGGDAPPSALPHVTDQSSYDAVPPGAQYTTPDGHVRVKGGSTASAPSGGFPVSHVMDALTAQESHGNGKAVGPATKYGRAYGSTQLQPGTAKEMATKLGLAFRPDMLHSNDASALRYQRALAEAYLQEGLEKTGNLTDALHYYHGGPDRSLWGPKTRAYASSVLARLQ